MTNIKSAKWCLLIMVHVFLVIAIVSSMSMAKKRNVFVKYENDWPQVQVSIDDVSFKYQSRKRIQKGKYRYYYNMNRILYYTYEGKDYEVEDILEYTSTKADYQVELRKNYTDKYTYQVNPEHPEAVRRSYSSLSDTSVIETYDMLFVAVPIIFLVIVDLSVLVNSRKKR